MITVRDHRSQMITFPIGVLDKSDFRWWMIMYGENLSHSRKNLEPFPETGYLSRSAINHSTAIDFRDS